MTDKKRIADQFPLKKSLPPPSSCYRDCPLSSGVKNFEFQVKAEIRY